MAEPPPLLRRRHLRLPFPIPAACPQRGRAYLALVDRPLMALLARERLQPQAPGRFSYQSNPHSVLHWRVVPTLSLAAAWGDGQLTVRSTDCRLEGLGDWIGSLGFTLEAVLEAEPMGLRGWAEVGLHSRWTATPIGQRLGSLALEAVLDRIERRVGRGLRSDLAVWLGEEGDSTGTGG